MVYLFLLPITTLIILINYRVKQRIKLPILASAILMILATLLVTMLSIYFYPKKPVSAHQNPDVAGMELLVLCVVEGFIVIPIVAIVAGIAFYITNIDLSDAPKRPTGIQNTLKSSNDYWKFKG